MKMIRRTYDFFESRRWVLYMSTCLTAILCLALFLRADVRADIRAMLPEGDNGELARDFDMLGQSSLSNNVFITLSASGNISREELLRAGDRLAERLQPPYFTVVDPTSVNPIKALEFLLDNAPNLVDETELGRVLETTNPESVKGNLEQAVHDLTSPQGVVMKSLIRRDPLRWRTILGPKLASLNVLNGATIENGHVLSNDGTAVLITARSDISMTDADGAAALLDVFNAAKKELPSTIQADLISGHVHTLANASTIKRDLGTVSLAALAALTGLFIIFFRSSRAVGVLLAPGIAMCAALGGLALFNGTVSAIVIGFGAVLIGISMDFAMHVYFAIARHGGSPGKASANVTRPILFCALTSCAAFGALFLSGIPGIRQLALFSISGLIAAAVFSLTVLPHLCRGARLAITAKPDNNSPGYPRAAMTAWAALMATSLFFGSTVTIDPDLRNIEYVPESVRMAETRFNDTWGDMRSRGVVFAQGQDLDEALAKNEMVHTALLKHFPGIHTESLAPLLPSNKTQAANRQKWNAAWPRQTRVSALTTLHEQGKEYGFSNQAFLPFEDALSRKAVPITPDSLDEASLGLIRETFMPVSASGLSTVVTFLPDSKEVQAFFSPETEQQLGVRLVSNNRFKTALESAMKSDIRHFILLSGLAVALLVLILFRDVRRTGLSLLPAVTGLGAVFGILGATNTDLNLFHITALPLIIGLGADYGIFMVSRESLPTHLDTTDSVKASGLTTLAGFGVLVLARHPSLHSMGVTVLAGVGAALLCALYLLPHLVRRQA